MTKNFINNVLMMTVIVDLNHFIKYQIKFNKIEIQFLCALALDSSSDLGLLFLYLSYYRALQIILI